MHARLAMLLLVAPSLGFAQLRTFTDPQGRTLQAEVVSVDVDSAMLRRSDGQTFDVSFERLSEADVAFLRNWRPPAGAVERPAAPTFSGAQLQFAATRKRTEVDRKRTESTTTATEDFIYVVTVSNTALTPVPELRAEYRIFFEEDTRVERRGSEGRRRTEGSAQVPGIPARGKSTFETSEVTLSSSSLNEDWRYTDGSRRWHKDRLAGLWVKLYDGSREVAQFSQPSNLAEKEDW